MPSDEDPAVTAARSEMEYFKSLMEEYGWTKATKIYYGEIVRGDRGGSV